MPPWSANEVSTATSHDAWSMYVDVDVKPTQLQHVRSFVTLLVCTPSCLMTKLLAGNVSQKSRAWPSLKVRF